MQECYQLTSTIIQRDPYALEAVDDILKMAEASGKYDRGTELLDHLAERRDGDAVFLSRVFKNASDRFHCR